jgi:serine carboxypeptidase-like clade 2
MYGDKQLQAGEWCSYDEGVEDYMNSKNVKDAFRTAKQNELFSICNMTIFERYKVDPKGSYASIPKLLEKGLRIYIVSGDWDDIVPFTDTLKNIKRMNLNQLGSTVPWSVNDQHAGFIRAYSKGLKFYTVKGAGHEVPLYQRERSFKVFKDFLYE